MESHSIDQVAPEVVGERDNLGACDEGQSWPRAQQHLAQAKHRADQLVKAHPGAALGAAVVMGLMLGWWVKR